MIFPNRCAFFLKKQNNDVEMVRQIFIEMQKK
ncbi:MAG: hypothetical protein ACI9XO_001398 [Paraglaciecola sp.]|jgi:hypothetical protein